MNKVSARRSESEKARNPQASPIRPIDEHFTGELGGAAATAVEKPRSLPEARKAIQNLETARGLPPSSPAKTLGRALDRIEELGVKFPEPLNTVSVANTLERARGYLGPLPGKRKRSAGRCHKKVE